MGRGWGHKTRWGCVMPRITYKTLPAGRGFWTVFLALGALLLIGLVCALVMETAGHVVTGMNNQIVWGAPHVFAVFLIVAASGALNVASIASVFQRAPYKPLAPLSALLAIGLLVGGLVVLVLDLGRPDRLLVAMTTYNFKSIFAWNIFLYVGFLGVAGFYLWFLLEPRLARIAKPAGLVAFLWRLVLTTGTGSIFGFLVARQAYDAAIMAPLFIVMSFSFGPAIFTLVLLAACRADGRPLGEELLGRLGRLQAIFVAVVLYFTAVQHLTNLYAAEHAGIERFILLDGGVFTALFWLGQVLIGGVLPLVLLLHGGLGAWSGRLLAAGLLVVVGGLTQVYVIIIGGQAFPLVLFPGREVTSTFFDGVVNGYAPSGLEIGLGIGGIALALVIVQLGLGLLQLLPESLADAAPQSPPEPEPEPDPEAVTAEP